MSNEDWNEITPERLFVRKAAGPPIINVGAIDLLRRLVFCAFLFAVFSVHALRDPFNFPQKKKAGLLGQGKIHDKIHGTDCSC